MLLGSAALGALAVGDAPYPFAPIRPPPQPPATARVPSGHNIFIGTNAATLANGHYVVYTFAGGELDELGVWTVYAQFSQTSSAFGFFKVVRNVDPIGGPISSGQSLVFGVLPEVPPQVNEPGVTLYFNIGGAIPQFSGVSLVFVKPSGESYVAAVPLVYIGPLSVTTASPGLPSFQGGLQPTQAPEDFVYIYSPQNEYQLPLNARVNQQITVKDASGTALTSNITISSAGGHFIDGASTFTINQNYGAYTFVWNGSQWSVI